MAIHSEWQNGTQATIVVGDTSLTGKAQIDNTSNIDNTIGTSRASVKMIMEVNGKKIEVQETPGLPLDSRTNIEERVSQILETYGDRFAFADEINVYFHAMAMSGIDKSYPQKIIQALQKRTNSKINAVLISYESKSHVAYGARNAKNNLEESLENSGADNKVVLDLLVFDSPSAKPLGPTFVGVVGDFISFLRSQKDASKEIQATLEKHLGHSFTSVQEFLASYPLRGELKDGQQSMKVLAAEGKFQAVVNEWTKRIDFAKLSYISPIISRFYLDLVGKYMQREQERLHQQSGRLLLSWDEVIKNIPLEELKNRLDALSREIEAHFIEDDTSEIYSQIDRSSNTVTYKYNPKFLHVVDDHFGIIPLMLQEDVVLKSGVLKNGEFIKTRGATSQIYTGDKIKVERKGDTITLLNAENAREVFCTMAIGSAEDIKVSEKPGFSLPKEDLQDDEIINTIAQNAPHRPQWIRTHLNGVIRAYNGANISPEATVLENIGFRLGNLIIRHKDFIQQNFGVPEEKLQNFQGKFLEIDTLKPIEELEEIIANGEALDVQIISLQKSPIRMTITVNIVRNNKIIGAYKFVGM